MFTIEQINDLHARRGNGRTLPEYVVTLKGLGVARYDSYVANSHLGRADTGSVSPPVHEVHPVAETGQRETVLQHLRRPERRETTYLEMSRAWRKVGWRSGLWTR